jgi:hypothetical protein
MEIMSRWPQLGILISRVRALGDLEAWLFGSALVHDHPEDLDILLVYESRTTVVALRAVEPWDMFCPPCRFIAMTRNEVVEYNFIAATGAMRMV